jgi:hypothetical protein
MRYWFMWVCLLGHLLQACSQLQLNSDRIALLCMLESAARAAGFSELLGTGRLSRTFGRLRIP